MLYLNLFLVILFRPFIFQKSSVAVHHAPKNEGPSSNVIQTFQWHAEDRSYGTDPGITLLVYTSHP